MRHFRLEPAGTSPRPRHSDDGAQHSAPEAKAPQAAGAGSHDPVPASVSPPGSRRLDVVLERPPPRDRSPLDTPKQGLRAGRLCVQARAVSAHARSGAGPVPGVRSAVDLPRWPKVGVQHVVGLLQARMARLDHPGLPEQDRRRRLLVRRAVEVAEADAVDAGTSSKPAAHTASATTRLWGPASGACRMKRQPVSSSQPRSSSTL
jgi:hypothetical protein